MTAGERGDNTARCECGHEFSRHLLGASKGSPFDRDPCAGGTPGFCGCTGYRPAPAADRQTDEERDDGYVTVGQYRVPKEPLRFPDLATPDPRVDLRQHIVAGVTEMKLRNVLRGHHPIMRSETGPFSGCRCGGVRLGEDVIGHVVDELQAALGGEG